MSTLTLPRPGRTPVPYPRFAPDTPNCAAVRHGTYPAYQKHGCRCTQAREAWRLYVKRRRQHRATPLVVDATGTVRRLRALAAIGWPNRLLAVQLGYTDRSAISQLYRVRHRVNIRTAAAVAALYEKLSMTPGPSARVRAHAQRAGWAPPLAWDCDADLDDPHATPAPGGGGGAGGVDQVVVDLAVAGRLAPHTSLTRAEQEAVVARLDALGLSAAQIAARMHTTARTITRIRRRTRQAS